MKFDNNGTFENKECKGMASEYQHKETVPSYSEESLCARIKQ